MNFSKTYRRMNEPVGPSPDLIRKTLSHPDRHRLPLRRLAAAAAVAAVLLATAPKSNSAHNAIIAAMQDIDHGKVGPVPRHLQNVHADSAGTGKVPTYKYPHVYPNHYVKQQYLPDLVKDAVYYEYGPNKTEQAAKRYWDEIKGDSASR